MWKIFVSIVSSFIGMSAYAETPFSWNARTDPIGWIYGGANARMDYRLNDYWTLGPAVQYIDRRKSGVKLNVFSGGLFSGYYFNQVFNHSWFTELGVAYGDVRVEARTTSGHLEKARVSEVSVRLLGGYHWFWDRFNLCLGLGIGTNSAGYAKITDENGKEVDSVPISPVGIAADASLGLAF